MPSCTDCSAIVEVRSPQVARKMCIPQPAGEENPVTERMLDQKGFCDCFGHYQTVMVTCLR